MGGAGWRSHSLRDFFAAQKTFVCLKEAPKQALCSLLTSDMLDILSSEKYIAVKLYTINKGLPSPHT